MIWPAFNCRLVVFTLAFACLFGYPEQRIAICAVPVAATFSARDNYALTSINVDGVNLLQGSGFHIIGSVGTNDDQNNVASESPYNSNGVMKAYNNAPGGGQVPYILKFSKDANDASKNYFTASVGKSTTSYSVMNIPLEANASLFTYWRHSNSLGLRRYDQNQSSYEKADTGKYYIEGVAGVSSWAEIIGSQYTIRVTITKSSVPMGLSFVNAPGLGGGIRDVEFGFSGLPANQKRTASGVIQVFRTDSSILPVIAYQSEEKGFHRVGRRDEDGWSVNVTDPSKNYLQFGPYVDVAPMGGVAKGSSQLTAGSHTATFRLLTDNNTANNSRILTIDVYDSVSGTSMKMLDIKRRMFPAANKYHDFTLDFKAMPGQRLEFRTYWWGGAYVRQDAVFIR